MGQIAASFKAVSLLNMELCHFSNWALQESWKVCCFEKHHVGFDLQTNQMHRTNNTCALTGCKKDLQQYFKDLMNEWWAVSNSIANSITILVVLAQLPLWFNDGLCSLQGQTDPKSIANHFTSEFLLYLVRLNYLGSISTDFL